MDLTDPEKFPESAWGSGRARGARAGAAGRLAELLTGNIRVSVGGVVDRCKGHKRAHKHKDPTRHGFWNTPSAGPHNQNVGSLCLSGLLGP